MLSMNLMDLLSCWEHGLPDPKRVYLSAQNGCVGFAKNRGSVVGIALTAGFCR